MWYDIKVGCFFIIAIVGLNCTSVSAQPYIFHGNDNIAPMLSLEDGTQTGIVVDLFAEISKRIDSEIKLELLDWKAAQDRVKQGDATGLVQLNVNPDREKYLLFSEPLLTSEFVIFHRRGDIHNQSLKDLHNKTVGVEAGGYPISLIRDQNAIQKRILESWEQGFRLLGNGDIDAVIVDKWVGEYVLATNNITGIVSAVKPVDRLVSHIAVLKDHGRLLEEINKAIGEMREDGSFAAILEQWRFSEVIYITKQKELVSDGVAVLLGISVILICVMFIMLFRLRTIQRELKQERNLLEDRVSKRTEELRQLAENEYKLRENEQVLRKQAQKAEKEALELAEAKTNFLATMSHELRTPLNAVIGFSDILQLHAKSGIEAAKLAEYSSAISASGRDLLHLINDVLDFAKIGDGQFELHNAPFSLNGELQNIQSTFSVRAKEQGISLDIDTIEKDLFLNGDNMRFRQVIYNLIDNAIKFSSEGSVQVNIETEKRHGRELAIRATIKDTGIGIPDDHLNHIFDPFTQQDGSITRQYGGTGLGLSISRSLARLMGGDLTVTSRLGTGSAFTASFIFEDFTDVSAAINHLETSKSKLSNERFDLKILAVDDVESNLDVLATMAKHLGCELHGFTDPKAAINWSKNHRTDMVMMDIHMPDMTGMEVASQIKAASDNYDAIPFFAWTADVAFERPEGTAGHQWDGVILKPTSREDLTLNFKKLKSFKVA